MTIKRSRSCNHLVDIANSASRKRVRRETTLRRPRSQIDTTDLSAPCFADDLDKRPRSRACNPLKRSVQSLDCAPLDRKNKRRKTEKVPAAPVSIDNWVSDLPETPQAFEQFGQLEYSTMMPNSVGLKRLRSGSDASVPSTPSDSESEGTMSRQTKDSMYRNPRYATLMESKGSFMRQSSAGPLPEEDEFCEKLLTEEAPLPNDPLFQPPQIQRLRALLQERSELRVCIDLHPRLVPSAEILALQHTEMCQDLVEGHNDRWLDTLVFYKKLPQPDRTVAYRPSAFTDEELQKLNILPERASVFKARDGMLFPFFTCEVKCGKEALAIADRANTNSMTIALRAVVELYRRAGTISSVHRKCLAFSLSHDDGTVRIYGHYPEVDGAKTAYFRKTIREFTYTNKNAEDRWVSYTFVWSLYTIFAPAHLRRLKEAIGLLPDPLLRSVDSQTVLNLESASGGEMIPLTPVTSHSGAGFAKPGPRQQVSTGKFMQEIEQQRKDFIAQLEQQQKAAKEREANFVVQLEQQRRDSKEQIDQLRRDNEQQINQLRRDNEQQVHQLQEIIALLKAQKDQSTA